MYVTTLNAATSRISTNVPLGTDEDGEPVETERMTVEFNDEGRARVTAEFGEHLAENYENISIDEREDGGE